MSTSSRLKRAVSSSMAMRLSAGEGGAEAAVDAVAETDGDAGRAADVELIGALERSGVAGGGPSEEQHREAGRDLATLVLAVLDREASLVLRWRQQAEDLLDRGGDEARVVDEGLPLIRMLIEEHHGVADQLGDRLRTGAAEKSGEASDLLVVEAGLDAIAAIDGDLREPAQHVVGWLLALLGDELREVDDLVDHRLDALTGRIHLSCFAVQREVEPLADLLSLAVGHAEHPGDDLDGEQGREVGDGVERLMLGDHVEVAADDLAHHGLESGDSARREHPADERTQAIVLWWVHQDDHPRVAQPRRILGERAEVDPVGARQALPVAVCRHDVVEPGQGVEAVPLAEEHRRLVPQPAVHLGRVVEVLGGEGVEVDRSACHAQRYPDASPELVERDHACRWQDVDDVGTDPAHPDRAALVAGGVEPVGHARDPGGRRRTGRCRRARAAPSGS